MTSFEKMGFISEIVQDLVAKNKLLRVNRGEILNGICRTLQIPRSMQHVKMIRAVLRANGIREVIIRGRFFYVSYPEGKSPFAKVKKKAADKKV